LDLVHQETRQAVRLEIVAALAKNKDATGWRRILRRFSSAGPALQRAILDAVLLSSARTSLLLDELEAGRIKATEIDAERARRLLNSGDADIAARAARLLAGALPADREQALAAYRSALAMESNAARGRAVFEKQCATCHQVDGLGIAFAPDISDSREKSAEQLLTDIIEPNRAIDSNYFSYTATTVDGLVHTGVLAAETSTSVTLKQAEGKSVTLRRDQIEELRSDGVSLMPDGLEKNIALQEMADLIAFIKNWRYLESAALPASAP
jgi:putative heme-binding domain-containing protein